MSRAGWVFLLVIRVGLLMAFAYGPWIVKLSCAVALAGTWEDPE